MLRACNLLDSRALKFRNFQIDISVLVEAGRSKKILVV